MLRPFSCGFRAFSEPLLSKGARHIIRAMKTLLALTLWFADPATEPTLQPAWSAVREMQKAAVTPAEKRFAARQAKLVATMQRLLDERNAARTEAAGDPAKLKQAEMSFNLQYLQLQSQMQQENRSYTAISNILKTKHDTVKNSISNIR